MKKFLDVFINKYIYVLAYLFLSVIIELTGPCFVGGKFFITKPWFFIMYLAIVCSIMIICNDKKIMFFVGLAFLTFQCVLAVGMVYLYDSNGTFFEWSMVNKRNDAFATVEQFNFNPYLVMISLVLIAVYVLAGLYFIYKNTDERIKVILKKYKEEKKKYKEKDEKKVDKNNKRNEIKQVKKEIKKENYEKKNYVRNIKIIRVITSIFLVVVLCTLTTIPFVKGIQRKKLNYVERYLYGEVDNTYQKSGITGNAIYEVVSSLSSNGINTSKDSTDQISKYLFGVDDASNQESFAEAGNTSDYFLPTSDYFGVSKNNNVVMVLVESFEWYAWFEGMFNDYDKATLKQAYPTLYNFYEQSVVMDNFYQRENTDAAEMLAIIGSNPSGKFIDYDFSTNALKWSLPHIYKDTHGGKALTQSFHQNDGDFYNRKELHSYIGFDKSYFIEEMQEEPYNVKNTWNQTLWWTGERTMDSLVWDAMKEEMIPETDDNFFTFAITFSMHGFYKERECFKNAYKGENYYDTLDGLGIFPESKVDKENYVRTYAAAVMDFDRALSALMQRIKDTNHEDDTTVLLFADHNTYYNDLSYFVKGIEKDDDSQRFNTELYHIPCMLYDKKLVSKMQENGEDTHIKKFTTTADIIPTMLDILGIRGWKNLYLGNSVFIKDVESVIYSRSYGLFLTDKLSCYSAKKLLFKRDDYTQKDYDSFVSRAKIYLNKLQYLDKIYYSDYFSKYPYVSADKI